MKSLITSLFLLSAMIGTVLAGTDNYFNYRAERDLREFRKTQAENAAEKFARRADLVLMTNALQVDEKTRKTIFSSEIERIDLSATLNPGDKRSNPTSYTLIVKYSGNQSKLSFPSKNGPGVGRLLASFRDRYSESGEIEFRSALEDILRVARKDGFIPSSSLQKKAAREMVQSWLMVD